MGIIPSHQIEAENLFLIKTWSLGGTSNCDHQPIAKVREQSLNLVSLPEAKCEFRRELRRELRRECSFVYSSENSVNLVVFVVNLRSRRPRNSSNVVI